ncbi:activating signal cointegrator 1 complex subunit [Entophlyctis luteolus]|nr:activating signal cointegrator 1 complex subunit [Entophlyctis luteolus]
MFSRLLTSLKSNPASSSAVHGWTADVYAAFKDRVAREQESTFDDNEYGRDLPFVDPVILSTRVRAALDDAARDTGDDVNDSVCSDATTLPDTDSLAEGDEDTALADSVHSSEQIEGAVFGSGTAASSASFDRDWLFRHEGRTFANFPAKTLRVPFHSQCENHIEKFADADTLSPLALCTQIFTILRMAESDQDIESNLLDSLGFENMDFISKLLVHRKEIVSNIAVNTKAEAIEDLKPEKIKQRPQYGAQVTVMSESDKKALKQQRKEAKKRSKMTGEENDLAESAVMLGFDVEHLKRAREQQLMNAKGSGISNPSFTSKPTVKYPHVYQAAETDSAMVGVRMTLPAGSTREDYQEYEEITIPVAKVAPRRENEELISITRFEPWMQAAYRGYKTLNRVQSLVYPVAFETNENMLVCAPTGAGKTDVAMLTVLKCISQFRKNHFIMKNDFKIVYVAPMKALAAEIVSKFSKRLGGSETDGGLGITVKELTGDMQLTKAEIASTQMIVTTPEKWDVVTRKAVGDTELAQKVKLLIIDEVHLLHEGRGSVIESIVSRTQRQVETSQSLIRIVGLSATLPNYVDVAQFLGVNPYQGLFYFDSGFRPVPLEQHFVGVKGRAGSASSRAHMDRVCYEKVVELVREGHQVMVFVHSRKDTVKTAMMLRDEALADGLTGIFESVKEDVHYANAVKEMAKSRNKELKELFGSGFGIHHAGMLRSDRNMVEKFFEKDFIRVLCCTATLAWGVNLPAYAAIIKGTQLYDSEKGSFVDLSILDVLQIFGRAGRPQYEDRGVGYIVTTHDKLNHYVSAMTMQHPIESKFAEHLTDNLNAEISLGTVTNVEEAIKWLSYSYLFVRMRKNPFHYGLDWKDLEDDPNLGKRCGELITIAARNLHKAQMIVFDETNKFLIPKDLCRISSSYYIRHATIEAFNTLMRPSMTEADVFSMLSHATEFENVKLRDEELPELKGLLKNSSYCDVKGGTDTVHGKTNILLQSYISRATINDFALVSDCAYVAQNSARILRALFEIFDRRMWSFEHPLSQFDLPFEIIEKLNRSNLSVEEMRSMDEKEVGSAVRHMKMGKTVSTCVAQFPSLVLETQIAPITQTVIRINLKITPGSGFIEIKFEFTVGTDFYWNDRIHGNAEPFWLWVEDAESIEILHSEYFLLTKRTIGEPHVLNFTIPIPRTSSTVDQLPPQIFVRYLSDKWVGCEGAEPISFKHLILPTMQRSPHTDLLPLQPLPVSALNNPVLEAICKKRFDYFNPVQTQIFHTLYHTNNNALIGAPTGSGKTVAAELALWSSFRDYPKSKVVYIAPLKALVRERVQDWRARLCGPMGKNLVELTGDLTPDLKTIQTADIIITTPEKWDGVSRSWQTRKYVTDVSLVIIDEIHLLGGDRGPILEVIVSRMNYISEKTGSKIRIVGLSTALANANDLGDWLHIKHQGLFNFRHSVRPVPLEVYIDGFSGKQYCPRMMSMNKPTYSAILTHSPTKPVIVFVSSRRQTRLTAQDLIAFCGLEDNPKRFLHMAEHDLESLTVSVKDQSLKLSLQFGIGLHHAGLVDGDRKLSEELFVNGKIQILIATSTLAWGVNYPAHLVVVKGTEYYDAKTRGYVDFPITDVLQMMGRAGRPQFDDSGVARIFVHDSKKNFYKKFLHEPFPVESSLHNCIHDHLNAEVVGGTIKSKQDAVDYLTWTYFYRRLQMNPTYYGVQNTSPDGISAFLSSVIETTFQDLANAACIEITQDFFVAPKVYGRIASYYYLSYKTVGLFKRRLSGDYKSKGDPEKGERPDGDFARLLRVLADAPEYDELPLRHTEDKLNQRLEEDVPVPVVIYWKPEMKIFGGIPEHLGFDDAHVKAFLLLQAHLTRVRSLPCSDYSTDTTSVLDQSIRIMQAMIDFSAANGFLETCLGIITMMQSIKQARWPSDSPILTLPHLTEEHTEILRNNKNKPIESLTDLCKMPSIDLIRLFSTLPGIRSSDAQEIVNVVLKLPVMEAEVAIDGSLIKNGVWQVDCGKEYEAKVTLRRQNSRGNSDFKVHAPKFPKVQTESWFVALGKKTSKELVDLKRVASNSDSDVRVLRCSLQFRVGVDSGVEEYSIHILSDGYLGLDQSIPVRVLALVKG